MHCSRDALSVALRTCVVALLLLLPARALAQVDSPNWAGYGLWHTKYTSISGRWTVPAVTYRPVPGAPRTQVSTVGIGIGNFVTYETTLILLGTSQDVTATGEARYTASYELGSVGGWYLNPDLYPVRPGDAMSATISCAAPCPALPAKQSWQLSLVNETRAWDWKKEVRYTSAKGTAEWVLVTASAASHLPHVSRFSFRDLTVNGSDPGLNATHSMRMGTHGTYVATPTEVQDGNSFEIEPGNRGPCPRCKATAAKRFPSPRPRAEEKARPRL